VDGRDQPAARGTEPGSKVVLALAVGALAVGALAIGGIAGWMAATAPRSPSYNYAGAVAGFWAMLILLGIVAIAVLGLLALFFRRWWLTASFVVGAGCLLGLFGGAWLTNAVGLGYKYTWPSFPSPPVYLHARGEASARLDGVAGFVTHSGSADCTSGPGSQVVATVDVWDAGELQGAMYRGDLHMHVAGIDPSTVGISVYFWSSSMTGSSPQWHGQGRLVTDEPSAGRVTFEHMALEVGRQPVAGTWPAELSGEISWSCGPWSSVQATQGP
jgi:hypothetical protein